MASSRDRQRKLAREKLDRQLARRAAAARRRRRIQAGVGAAVVLVLIVAGAAWGLGAFDREPEQKAAEDVCLWTPQDAAANTNLKDVGTPATKDLPTTGVRTMTIDTDQGGPITAELDLAGAPCAGASIAHLAGASFYDNTKCHEITAEGRCAAATRAAPAWAAPATRSTTRTSRRCPRRARRPAPPPGSRRPTRRARSR